MSGPMTNEMYYTGAPTALAGVVMAALAAVAGLFARAARQGAHDAR